MAHTVGLLLRSAANSFGAKTTAPKACHTLSDVKLLLQKGRELVEGFGGNKPSLRPNAPGSLGYLGVQGKECEELHKAGRHDDVIKLGEAPFGNLKAQELSLQAKPW